MTTTSNIVLDTRKIGLNKGQRRIWLEGKILLKNGFTHGDRFDVISNGDNHLIIAKNAQGERKISGKPDKQGNPRPIIDMSASTITSAFNDNIKMVSIAPINNGIVLTGIKS